jgi:hypothetical protein
MYSKVEQLLLKIGRVESVKASGVESLLGELSEREIKQLVKLANFHKAQPQVYMNLSSLSLASSATIDNAKLIIDAIHPAVENNSTRVELLKIALQDLSEALPSIPVVGLKGICVEDLYNERTGERMLADADIFVQLENLWELLATLIRRGYSVDKLRLGHYKMYRGNPDLPQTYGICPTTKESDNGPIYLDIHIGAFPSCGEGLIPISKDDLFCQNGIWFPKLEKTISIFLAHIIRQGFCRLRDINDLYLLLQQPEIKYATLTQGLQSEHLEEIFKAMLRLVAAFYPAQSSLVSRFVKSQRLRLADKWLLMERRREAKGYTDYVRFTKSRLWQVRYLSHLYRQYYGFAGGLFRAIRNTIYLYQAGRPYRITNTRTVGDLSKAERFVLCPLVLFQQQIDQASMQPRRSDLHAEWERLPSFGLTIANSGKPNELIIAPGFILTQCAYDGDRSSIPDLSEDLAALLQDLAVSQYKRL